MEAHSRDMPKRIVFRLSIVKNWAGLVLKVKEKIGISTMSELKRKIEVENCGEDIEVSLANLTFIKEPINFRITKEEAVALFNELNIVTH
jgi:hypothetical protein